MAYYGNGSGIEQGAAGLGQPPWAGAYADGVLGGRPGEGVPGPLQAFRDGVFSSLEGALGLDTEETTTGVFVDENWFAALYGAGAAVVIVGVAVFAMSRKRRA